MHHSLRVILYVVIVPQSNVDVLGKVYKKVYKKVYIKVVCFTTCRLLLITSHHYSIKQTEQSVK